MEKFDRHIKSKIDSLHEVPGVEFDEESVWKRIKFKSGRNLFFFIGSILLLISLVIILLPKNESQRKITEYNQVKESISKVLIDSSIVQNTEEILFKNLKEAEVDSVRDLKSISKVVPKDNAYQSTPIHPVKKVSAHKQSTSPPQLGSGQVNKSKKEYSITAGKDNQTIGITHSMRLENRLLFVHGIQFNRGFNHGFSVNEPMFMPFEINQIQIPLGVRYNLFKRERRFKPHLFAGFLNSLLLSSDARTMEYNLKFEFDLVLKYQIYSTKDGKKGYLRFRVPIYNKDIINQGVYKPSLYNVLKH